MGCGNGAVSLIAAQKGFEVQGLDISNAAVTWARERFRKEGLSASLHQGDAADMAFSDDKVFDVVIDSNGLHCVFDEKRRSVLHEIHRVLKSNGIVLISSMCGVLKSKDARFAYDSQKRCLLLNGLPYRILKPAEDVVKEIEQAQFKILDVHVSPNPWWDHLTLVAQA